MKRVFHIAAALWAARAAAAVFAPTEGYFGISLPYIPPASALDLRVEGNALSPLDGTPTNRTFATRPADPQLGAAADYFHQGNLVLAAMEMENLRRSTPPAIWSRMPLGDLYFDIGWYPQAIDFCEQALAFSPDLEGTRRVYIATLIAAGRTKEACAAAEKYAALRRDEPVAHYLLASAKYAAGRIDAALLAVDASLIRNDRRTETWRLKAQLLLEEKRPRDAVEAALRCRNVQGGGAPILLILGRAFELLDDRKQAESFYREAARGDPPPLEALIALARFREHTDPGASIEAMEKAADVYPNAVEVHQYLAKLYGEALRMPEAAREKSSAAYLEGRVDEALEAALDAIAGDAAQAVNYVNASALLQQRGELKAAESMAEQAQARFPNDAAIAIRLAQVKAARGDGASAVRVLENARPAVVSNPAVRFELARLLAAEGRYDKALEIVEPMMASASSPEAFRLAGNWRLAAGQMKIAQDIYARGLQVAPLNPDLLNGYAYATMSLGGSANDVLPLARKASELVPGDAQIADTLGWVLAESSHTAEAVNVLEQAMKKMPDNLTAGFHYALACARDGQPEKAAKKLKEIIATAKAFPDLQAAHRLLEKVSGEQKPRRAAGETSSGGA